MWYYRWHAESSLHIQAKISDFQCHSKTLEKSSVIIWKALLDFIDKLSFLYCFPKKVVILITVKPELTTTSQQRPPVCNDHHFEVPYWTYATKMTSVQSLPVNNGHYFGVPGVVLVHRSDCKGFLTCRQFHQHKMRAFFVRTLFRQLFFSYMYIVKTAKMYVSTKNSYV